MNNDLTLELELGYDRPTLTDPDKTCAARRPLGDTRETTNDPADQQSERGPQETGQRGGRRRGTRTGAVVGAGRGSARRAAFRAQGTEGKCHAPIVADATRRPGLGLTR